MILSVIFYLFVFFYLSYELDRCKLNLSSSAQSDVAILHLNCTLSGSVVLKLQLRLTGFWWLLFDLSSSWDTSPKQRSSGPTSISRLVISPIARGNFSDSFWCPQRGLSFLKSQDWIMSDCQRYILPGNIQFCNIIITKHGDSPGRYHIVNIREKVCEVLFITVLLSACSHVHDGSHTDAVFLQCVS